MADGKYSFEITVEGGDVSARTLGSVASAQDKVTAAGGKAAAVVDKVTEATRKSTVVQGQAAVGAGGLTSAWGKLDGGVSRVMGSMGGLNDVLDITKIAIGAGLSGPIGQAIGAFVDLGAVAVQVIDKLRSADTTTYNFSSTIRTAAAEARKYGFDLGGIAEAGRDFIAGISDVDPSTLGGEAVERGMLALKELKDLALERQRLGRILETNQNSIVEVDRRIAAEGFTNRLNDAKKVAQLNIDEAKADMDRLAEKRKDLEATNRVRFARAEVFEVPKVKVKVEVDPDLNFEIGPEGLTGPLQSKLAALFTKELADLKVDLDEIEKLVLGSLHRRDREPVVRSVVDEIMAPLEVDSTARRSATGAADRAPDDRGLIDVLGGIGVAGSDEQFNMSKMMEGIVENDKSMSDIIPTLTEQAGDYFSAQADGFDGMLKNFVEKSSDLASMAASAITGVADAVGTTMANMVAGVDEGSGNMSRAVGDVMLMLSQQAMGYAIFLGALGLVSAIPGLGAVIAVMTGGANTGALLAGAAAMAGIGITLGLSARALGTTKSKSIADDKAAAKKSAAAATEDAKKEKSKQGEFGSFGNSKSDRPIEVTVILSADALHDSAVSVSGQRQRAGSISAPRLAVARGF